LLRMPGIQGNLVAATGRGAQTSSTVMVLFQSLGVAVAAVKDTTRRYCRCSSIHSACSPPFTGCSPLQINTTQPHPDGIPVVLGQGNQKAAGRHGRQLGVRNTPAGNLRTITPISMAGQIPAFDFVTLGLAIDCPCPAWASCRSRKPVRAVAENGPGRHGRTRQHPSIIQQRQDITAIPHWCRSHPESEFEVRPARPTQPRRPGESNGTVVSPSARLRVCSSVTGLM
jgi:hypothetical protein